MKTKQRAEKGPIAYGWTDLAVMTGLTLFSIYRNQASVFYIIYFFWWSEFLHIMINGLFDRYYKRERSLVDEKMGLTSGFLLFIYWVFIVVIFGFIANWDNKDVMAVNFGVLFFKNIFFNLNLIFIVAESCFRNIQIKNKVPALKTSGFTPNMVVLHISIIFGAFILFWVLKRYPNTFTPENPWGSILIIAPFLILRTVVQLFWVKK